MDFNGIRKPDKFLPRITREISLPYDRKEISLIRLPLIKFHFTKELSGERKRGTNGADENVLQKRFIRKLAFYVSASAALYFEL